MLHRRVKTLRFQREDQNNSSLHNHHHYSSFLDKYLFPNLPDHYPLRKKIQITKNNTSFGFFYDLSQDFCTLLMCALYITASYFHGFKVLSNIQKIDKVLSGYVFFDLLLGWYLAGDLIYFFDFTAFVDTLSVAPFIFDLICRFLVQRNFGYSFVQGVRTLRLVRIIRMFKTLRFFHSARRIELRLVLTLTSLVFIIAGLFQYLEADLAQKTYDCQFIGEKTDWLPSCSSTMPEKEMISCDCEINNCLPFYDYGDRDGQPSLIRCQQHSFFTCIYYLVITTAGVGYGDITPSRTATKGLIMFSILFSIITIPPQINELLTILSMKSNYKRPYKPTHHDEHHIILCGQVNNKSRLEQFFKEFFHPDRMFSSGPEYHVVILTPNEPSEAVKDLIISSMLDSRVTYVVGSALSVEDLKKVRADIASGIFFFCNTEVSMESAKVEDATTVMRMLSVSNFNPDVECYVQVIRPEDRTILKDSDVEFILCLDEFKTTLIARNSICPGFSTFIENIFHTFGAIAPEEEAKLAPWYSEYLHGARMEMYYVPLDQDFLRAIHFDFDKLCEAVFIEYGIIVLALCNADQDSITFNPNRKDLGKHRSFKSFFQEFNVALIIADDNTQAEEITKGLSDTATVASILQKIEVEEDNYPVRYYNSQKLKDNDFSTSKRGLKRNKVIAPTKADDILPLTNNENGLTSQNSIFSVLQGKSISVKTVPKKILKHPVDDFDSDESDAESKYIGYRKIDDTKIDEFQRSSVVYTKSHEKDSQQQQQQQQQMQQQMQLNFDNLPSIPINPSDIITPPVKIVLNTSARRTMARSNSIIQKLNIPLVNTSQIKEQQQTIEKSVSANSRAARKSMAMPIVKKRMLSIHPKLILEDDESGDESDDEKDEDDNDNDNDNEDDNEDNNEDNNNNNNNNNNNKTEIDEIKAQENNLQEEKSFEADNTQEKKTTPKKSSFSFLKAQFANKQYALIHPAQKPATRQEELLLHAASLWALPAKDSESSSPNPHSNSNTNITQNNHTQNNNNNNDTINNEINSNKNTSNIQNDEKMIEMISKSPTNIEQQQQQSSSPSILPLDTKSNAKELSSVVNKNSPRIADIEAFTKRSLDSTSKLLLSTSPSRPRRLSPIKAKHAIEKGKSTENQTPLKNSQSLPSQNQTTFVGPQLELLTPNSNDPKKDKKIKSIKLNRPVCTRAPSMKDIIKDIEKLNQQSLVESNDNPVEEIIPLSFSEDNNNGSTLITLQSEGEVPPSPISLTHYHDPSTPLRGTINEGTPDEEFKDQLPSPRLQSGVIVNNSDLESLSTNNPNSTQNQNQNQNQSTILSQDQNPSLLQTQNQNSTPRNESVIEKTNINQKTLLLSQERFSGINPNSSHSLTIPTTPSNDTDKDIVKETPTDNSRVKFKILDTKSLSNGNINNPTTNTNTTKDTNNNPINPEPLSKKSIKESLFSRALKSFKKPLMKRLSGASVSSEIDEKPSNDEDSTKNGQNSPRTEIDTVGDRLTPGNYGLPSKEIFDLYDIKNHIIVFGNTTNLPMFIPELRRPTVRGDTYHPLVIVSPTEPERWQAIQEKYNDVYFLRGSLTRTAIFNRANIDEAFAVILFSHRDEQTKEVQGVNEYNADSDTLFTYLKLEQHVPRNVFFSVELTCSENMAVLNSTIIRRVSRANDENGVGTIVTDKQRHASESNLLSLNIDKDHLRTSLKSPLINTNQSFARPRSSLISVHEDQQIDDNLLSIQTNLFARNTDSDEDSYKSKRVDNSPYDHNEGNISRKPSISGNLEGRFTTKRLSRVSSISPNGRKQSTARSNSTFPSETNNLRRQISTMHRRVSTIEYEPELEKAKENSSTYDVNKEETFWDATDTHHMLPVFASARAYVPSSFMSLLVQSFFSVLTPLICEKLVCGQTGQSVVQIALPKKLVGRRFLDLYRVFCFHHVICFGLYRAPQKHLNALLPYIYITPPPNTILFNHDRVFLYGKASRIARAIKACKNLK